MLSLTRKPVTIPPAAGTGSGSSDGPAGETLPATAIEEQVRAFDGRAGASETRRGHSRRMARRTRLHGYALFAVALFAFVIALAASNTAHVRVSWLFGTSHVSLVWLVLVAAVLGWLLGLLTNATLHRRTRAPRPASRLRS
jgi:uncharacterized integral membrane protein